MELKLKDGKILDISFLSFFKFHLISAVLLSLTVFLITWIISIIYIYNI